MNRRDLIRGVASTGLLAVGAGAAAGQVTDAPAGDPPLRAIRQEDGSYEIVEAAALDAAPAEMACGDRCNDAYCCSECTCYDCCGCYEYC